MRGRRLYQKLAESAAKNAKGLLADANVLRRRGSAGHACSLAVLSIEESAKSIIYRQAALGVIRFVRRNPNNLSTYSEKDLVDHRFKHATIHRVLVAAIGYAPFHQALSSTRKKTFKRHEVESMFRQVHTRQVLLTAEVRGGGRAALELNKLFEVVAKLNQYKNSGLYVGRTEGRIVKPNDVPREALSAVLELAGQMARSADQLAKTPVTSRVRREAAEQQRILAANARRLKVKTPPGTNRQNSIENKSKEPTPESTPS